MTITGHDLLQASFLNVLATRLPDGRLQIGDRSFEQWPESFEFAGVKFALTEVEDEVMAIYFPDGDSDKQNALSLRSKVPQVL